MNPFVFALLVYTICICLSLTHMHVYVVDRESHINMRFIPKFFILYNFLADHIRSGGCARAAWHSGYWATHTQCNLSTVKRVYTYKK